MIAYCLQKTCVLSIPDVFGRFPQLIENNLVGYDSKGMIDERNVKRIKRPSICLKSNWYKLRYGNQSSRSVTLRTIPALRPIKDKTFLKIVLVRLTYHGTKDFTECRLMWVIDAVNSCFIWETSTQTRETIHMDVYLPHRKHFSFAIKS